MLICLFLCLFRMEASVDVDMIISLFIQDGSVGGCCYVYFSIYSGWKRQWMLL